MLFMKIVFCNFCNQISLRKLRFANLNGSLEKQKLFLPYHHMLYQCNYGFLSLHRHHKLHCIHSILSIVRTDNLERLLNELKWKRQTGWTDMWMDRFFHKNIILNKDVSRYGRSTPTLILLNLNHLKYGNKNFSIFTT